MIRKKGYVMHRDVICPKCQHEFEANWDTDKCPKCNNRFIFDEQCTEDFSDCWTVVLWQSNNWEY